MNMEEEREETLCAQVRYMIWPDFREKLHLKCTFNIDLNIKESRTNRRSDDPFRN